MPIHSNLRVQPRFRNDWSVFSKVDYRDSKDDRFCLSLNWNGFDSPGGFILGTQTALFGKSSLANAFVLISPGMNNYNALFVPRQRRLRNGLAFQTAYTFSKNIMSHGV